MPKYDAVKWGWFLSNCLSRSVNGPLSWLDWTFLKSYCSSLRLNYDATSNVMVKTITIAVLQKDETSLWFVLCCRRSFHSNVMTSWQFLLSFVFLSTMKFFRKSLAGAFTSCTYIILGLRFTNCANVNCYAKQASWNKISIQTLQFLTAFPTR